MGGGGLMLILTPKIHPLTSINPCPTSLHSIPPSRFLSPTCNTPLRRATSFSSSVKNLAFSGLSGKNTHATTAMHTVGSPSTRNNTLHFANPGLPLVIPYASAPANVFASGAALRNMPARRPSSWRR